MVDRQANVVLQGLCKLVEAQAAQLSDGQLLQRFAAGRDEAAFAVLLQRYSRLVYSVCRNVLRHDHDAEDAFQATFLVLARRAGAIRSDQAIGSWLYRVAYRVSIKARTAAERRRRQESQAAQPPEARPTGDLAWRELQAMLDRELNRLPDKYRAPFVLCCLLGKSKTEAAADLNWKEGTVSSRLSHARQLLRTRLARRGVTLSALLSGLAISEQGDAGTVPPRLIAAVQDAAPRFLRGETIATTPAVLARSVLRGMAATRLTVACAFAAIVSLAGVAAAFAFQRPIDPVQPVSFGAPAAGPPIVAASEPAEDGLHQLVVRGRVVDGDGKPVAGADVAMLADEDRAAGHRDFHALTRRRVVAVAKADAEGRFQFLTPRPVVRMREDRYCIARGEGQAVNWQRLQTLLPVPPVELKLEKGQTLHGRIVDANGKPAAGVTLRFGGFRRASDPLPVVSEDIAAPAWPAPIVTDDEGKFALKGILRNATVFLQIQDDRYGPHWLAVKSGDTEMTDAGTIKLPSPRVLEGTVLADDNFKPLANASVTVSSGDGGGTYVPSRIITRTDDAGRYSAKIYPGKSLTVTAAAADGMPYVGFQKFDQFPEGASRHEVNLYLERGEVVRGRVVELGSGKPVAGARIVYRPMSAKNPNGRRGNLLVILRSLDAVSDDNGNFQIQVLRGPGHLLVRGPDHHFVPMEVGDDELIEGKKGGDRLYFPDGLVPIDVKVGKAPQPVAVVLRRGVTLGGRVETADGKPASGFLISRTYLGSGFEENCEFLPVRDGRFEIPGCDAGTSEPYWFWDHIARQGAMVHLSANKDATVRLAPFGSATLRFVDAKGNVVRVPSARINLVVRPGRGIWDPVVKDTPRRMTQDASFQGVLVDQSSGVITAKSLVPGATYVIETNQGYSSPPFSVASGQNQRLPDVAIPLPPKAK
jgi:RNA polymerase sigma factor (sigma-70 family)